MKKITTEGFIERAKAKHGDFFDYSETVYVNRRTKVYIICPVHGGFWQYPETHIKSDYGCPMCGHEGGGVVKRDGFDTFVKKANAAHKNKYSYEKVKYINSNTKVEIICPEHGVFTQTPAAHIHGQGCPLCAVEMISKKRRYSQQYIIEMFKRVHGDEYDYSKVVYKGLFKKVAICCRKHGVFYQTPAVHIHSKSGCPICSNIKKGLLGRQSKEEFIKKAKSVHKDRYDYHLVPDDALTNEKVPIICSEHGVFFQTKNNHLMGHGCPHCPNERTSIGEEMVSDVLLKNNIQYIPQYKIRNENLLCNNKNIYIDFYLPKYNTFIEYNGIQHYEPIEAWGGVRVFEEQQRRDTALRQYCVYHKIKLIEIPYWDCNNIEIILKKELKIE